MFKPLGIKLKVSYVVINAGWNAMYDVRALNTKSPLQLSYKANVFQSTGEDWKNVKLKLSTANRPPSFCKTRSGIAAATILAMSYLWVTHPS